MKPCIRWKQDVALFAAASLEPAKRPGLEAHLKTCPECQSYFHEIRELAQVLSPAASSHEIAPSFAFHRELTAKIHRPTPSRAGHWIPPFWRGSIKWLLPVFGAVAIVIAGWQTIHHITPATTETVAIQAHHATPAKKTTQPTLGRYQGAARHSMEGFESALLEDQKRTDNREPIYSVFSRISRED